MKINKADKGAGGLRARIRFHLGRGQGHLARYAWNRVRWNLFPRFHWAGRYPDHVDLELSAACNMTCPMCYTVTPQFKDSVPHINMDFGVFKKIVDELAAHRVYSIRLSWRGEPTLNAHFMDCVRYAKKQGIKEVDSLTNALRLTPEMFEELVDLQMDWLTVSFDGTGEVYNRIRKPAIYSEMLAKLQAFADIKARRGSRKPVVRVQGIWPAIAENPAEYFDALEPVADEVSVNTLLDYLHSDDDIEYIKNFVCPVPFQRLAIGSDGRAFMCINDEMGRVEVGNTKQESVYEIWNGKRLREVRETHQNHNGIHAYAPCRDCYQPRKTRKVAHTLGQRTIYLDELVGRPQVVGK
jgi:radical SAM protein with 4Fe4S-binding SPASM domain